MCVHEIFTRWRCTNMYTCVIFFFFVYIFISLAPFVRRSVAKVQQNCRGGEGRVISFRDLKYELLGKTGHSDRRPAVCPHTHSHTKARARARTHTPVSAGKRHISRFANYARAIFLFEITAAFFTRPCVFQQQKSRLAAAAVDDWAGFLFRFTPPPPSGHSSSDLTSPHTPTHYVWKSISQSLRGVDNVIRIVVGRANAKYVVAGDIRRYIIFYIYSLII